MFWLGVCFAMLTIPQDSSGKNGNSKKTRIFSDLSIRMAPQKNAKSYISLDLSSPFSDESGSQQNTTRETSSEDDFEMNEENFMLSKVIWGNAESVLNSLYKESHYNTVISLFTPPPQV
ncbi:hypothetical protein SAMN04515674_11318 [Pseudarcicella hirudinis]|uniref:Uncharacterized protein n=2 Tax=Pseudarcicella hirudinis TaxID=1079859 RepID=A0A1I5WYH9_9BACT|nr:hypothetical protein SAMN04515674_11318 [Pseudarcicella hirudinis]